MIFKTALNIPLSMFNDIKKKGKKQVKKIITFKASDIDLTPDIVIKLRPEKYNPIEETAINANFFNVGCIII
tara:strand:+ start:545 stop:760 length:216 start_codon:yes stop_codon:yes gene_type:complete